MQSRGHLLLLPPIPIVCIAPIQIFFNIQFLFSFSSYCPDITDNGLCLAAVRDLFLRTNFPWRNLSETIFVRVHKVVAVTVSTSYIVQSGWSSLHSVQWYSNLPKNRLDPIQSVMLTSDGYFIRKELILE